MTNEEARKILDSSLVWSKMVDEECEALGMAIKALEEQKNGKWIPRSEDCRGYTSCFECSNCHAFTYLSYCEKSCDYECCPNCGARMEVYGYEDSD